MSAKRKARQREPRPQNRISRVQREYVDYPPVNGIVWSAHARIRFGQRVTDAVEPDVLYDYIARRVPSVNPRYTGPIVAGRGSWGDSPFILDVQDVCRLIVDWKSNVNPASSEYWTRGIWVVVTVYDWVDRFVMRSGY